MGVMSSHLRAPRVIVAVLRSDGEARGKRVATELYAEKIYSGAGSGERGA